MSDDEHHYVYITTNLLNNKKYIGKRMCRCEIAEDQYLGSGKALQNAIQKYGKENFYKEVIEICENHEHCNEREKYWINFYDAVKNRNFYNIASGGDGGDTYSGLSQEELEKIRKIKSEKSSGKNNPRYGAILSEKTKQKISVAYKERYKKTGLSSTSGKFGADNKLSKKIVCLETNEIFIGIREASRVLGIPSPNIITSLKSGGRRSAGKIGNKKRHWMYYEDYDKQMKEGIV